MSDHFAFLLPVTMVTFGCAFLVVRGWGSPAALPWGVAYLLGAVAFSCPVVLVRCSDDVQAIVSDALFAVSFFFYAQGFLVQFRRPRVVWLYGLICLAGIAASVVSVTIFKSLRLELMSNDATCSILMGVALMSVRRSLRRPVDRALFFISVLNVIDNLVRGGAAPFITATDDLDAYMSSSYAFFEQASAAVLTLVFGLTVLAAVTFDVIARYRAEALTDPLTGLWNRRGFEATAPDATKAAVRQGCVISCDIDHFKRVNDTFGHAVGDAVITTVAGILKAGLPPGAVVSRFGGEEFIVYLPAPDGQARLLADQVRLAIAGYDWAETGVDWPLTASFGLAEVDVCDASLHNAIARADRSLYNAKLAGRNRVSACGLAA